MTRFDRTLKQSYRLLSEAKIGDSHLPGLENYEKSIEDYEKSPGQEEVEGKSANEIPMGMVPCDVEYHHSAWLVTFDDGSDLLLQSDYDQASFAAHSADSEGKPIIVSPPEWDGTPSTLPGWENVEASDIAYCLSDYQDQASKEEEEESSSDDMEFEDDDE